MLHHRRLADSERVKFQNPESILRGIGLKAGDTLIDLGCGEGYFALPAARIVGEGGRVYGIDVNGDALAVLADKARNENRDNLVVKTARAEDTVLCRKCADFVFLGIVLHDFDDPERVLRNAHAMVKPGGRLVNLDWKKEPMEFGPPLAKKFDDKQATGLIEAAGFIIENLDVSAPYHYLITARPKLENRE